GYMAPESSFLDDVDRFRLPEGVTSPCLPRARKNPPRHSPGERFLKGPIPWNWLKSAARLPGHALQVALAVWQKAGMRRNATVPLSLSQLEEELGVKRDAARRGLEALEGAKLVKVERRLGRKSLVTLLSWPDAGPREERLTR